MTISPRGLKLIIGWETFKSKPYLCPAGKWTIGFGHVILPHEHFTQITMEKGQELLKQDCAIAEKEVNTSVKVPIHQFMFDAMVSFAFNVGISAFRTSTLLRQLNAGRYALAARQFCKWDNTNHHESDGLENRRAEEALLFTIGAVKAGYLF
jgi:lysozyme